MVTLVHVLKKKIKLRGVYVVKREIKPRSLLCNCLSKFQPPHPPMAERLELDEC